MKKLKHLKNLCTRTIATLLMVVLVATSFSIPAKAKTIRLDEDTLQKIETSIGRNREQEITYTIQSTNATTIDERLKHLLGSLETLITSEERQKSYQYITQLTQLEEVRAGYEQSKEELALVKEFNTYLDNLTKKYIPDAQKYEKELEDAFGKIKLPSKNPIIENLKKQIKASDYKKLKKLYAEYVKNQSKFMIVADAMYNTLLKYKSLNADEVLTNIFTAEYGLKAKFKINSNYSLSYISAKGTGLASLTKKKITEYKNVWSQVKLILPTSLLSAFREFDISSDGEYGIAAFVEQLDDAGATWRLSIDPADMKDKEEFYHTVIHEFGHYVSLNNNQVKYMNGSASALPNKEDFFNKSMTANTNSYINQFYNKYWKDYTYDRISNPFNPTFYFRHRDEFVSIYSTTSCTEDFAECFAYFVLEPQNSTPQMKEKTDFFNQFPELVQIKQTILTSMKSNNLIK